ncbi:MAG: P-loop NTPase [Candidatus Tectimicrobiota bacterium]
MPKRYRDIAGDGGSNVAAQVAEHTARLQARMAQVRHTVAIMSGKGGVGKSTVTTNLATYCAQQGWRVGVVDADINGPSLAKMFGVRGQRPRLEGSGVVPALDAQGVQVMSMDLFLAEDKTPVLWDGPASETFFWRGTMEMHTLREFLTDVQWGALDVLLLDLPPGADRLTTVKDLLPGLDGIVVVTIPSEISQLVVLKSITMARDLLHTPIIGLVENMTSYLCPTCGDVHPLFRRASEADIDLGIPLLGRLPFDPRMAEASDCGRPYVLDYGASRAGQALSQIGARVLAFLEALAKPVRSPVS